MEIAKGDNALKMIDLQIRNIYNDLMYNHNHNLDSARENELLEDVAGEYKRYCESMLKEKHNEQEALWMLTNYIQDTAKEEDTSGYLLEELKKDQKSILQEIKEIKKIVKQMEKQIIS
jgi:hypothetical protein